MLLCLSAAGVSMGVSCRRVRLRQCWPWGRAGTAKQTVVPSAWKVPAVTQLCGPTERWLEGWKCNKIANNQAKNIADVVPCSDVLEY